MGIQEIFGVAAIVALGVAIFCVMYGIYQMRDARQERERSRKETAERIEALPVSAGNYRSLAVNDSSLFYLNKDKGDFNRFEYRSVGPRNLFA